MNMLSGGGSLSGVLVFVQIGVAILTFILGIVESVLAYWRCSKVPLNNLDHVMAMV